MADCPDCAFWKAERDKAVEHAMTYGPRLALAGAIKPLEWQETCVDRGDGSSEVSGWEADNGFGSWYAIVGYMGTDAYGWQVFFDCDEISDCEDPEKAKALAQTHFEARIRGAMVQP